VDIIVYPVDMLGQIAVEYILVQLALVGGSALPDGNNAPEQPPIALLDHQSSAGVAQTGARSIAVSRAETAVRHHHRSPPGAGTDRGTGDLRLHHPGILRPGVRLIPTPSRNETRGARRTARLRSPHANGRYNVAEPTRNTKISIGL